MTDDELDDVCDRRNKQSEIRDDAQAKIDDFGVEIGTELALRGLSKVECLRYTPQLVDGERTSLSETRLLELGVPADIINAARVSTSFSQIRVLKRGGADKHGTWKKNKK